MAAALTKQAAAMGFQMPNQIDALHARLGAQSLSNHHHTGELLFRERAICLEDQLDRFPQVRSRFVERFALGVRARQFLNEGDVASFWGLTEDGCQFEREWLGFHDLNVPRSPADV
jgi:hypothetical protein